MGIQGLLPLLANSTRTAHISEFEDCFVAIDGYCWLHKGIYSCAFELAMKKRNTKYVTYCLRYIEMLQHFKVKPILVFDGRQLIAKIETEKKRREERRKKFEKGKELMRAGKHIEGRKLLGESVDVTHELALNVIKVCRERNIDCIVAPHEADAQLAYLSLKNIVKCVVTEDSDLLAYGCERVMFKMDTSGRGKLVEKSNIHLSMNMTPEEFNEDIFRYMCILSGCDYLPSLPSIGPATALKFIKMVKGNDIYDVLPKLPLYLNKLNIKVTPEYILGFKMADATFKHQLVYDPLLRLQVPLQPAKSDDDIVGTKLPDDLAFDLAVGNIDPMTMKKVDDFDPDQVGKGFTILWKTDLIPNAAPRRLLTESCPSFPKSKKRLRENQDFNTVQSVANDLKKKCIPLNNSNRQSIPKSGFDFDPKVPIIKKNIPNSNDKFKLLRSRYFLPEIDSRQDKHIASKSDKRKDESNEDYMQRLLNEYFPLEHEEAEIRDEGCCCGTQDENKIPENFCSLCEKCHVCCRCLNESGSVSDSQKLDESVGSVEEPQKKKEQHFLLDEIDKTQAENTKEKPQQEENKSDNEYLSFNFSKILSRLDSVEKEEAKTEPNNEKNSEVNCDKQVEPVRTPSPVFKVRKEVKVLNKSCQLQDVLDTAGTPTSVYFSNSGSRSLKTPSPKVSSSRAQTPSVKSFTKARKSQTKAPTTNGTLFQFGFKKQ